MFASVGDVILRGGMPYRDGWETRGPLAFYIFALAEDLFGRHMWSVRICDLVLLIAGMLALTLIVRRLTSPIAGYWAALIYVFWVGSLTWFHTAEPDAWMAIFIILSALPLFEMQASQWRFAFSGLMVGCAGLIKPLSFAFLVLPLIGVLSESRWGRRSLLRSVLVTGAALVAPTLAAVWFAYRGALHDLIDVHVLYAAKVYSGTPGIGTELRGLARFLLTPPVLLVLPIILVGIVALWRRRTAGLLTLTWAAIALMSVVAQAKFFTYHWIPLFAPMLILGTVGVNTLIGRSRKGVHQSGRSSLLLVRIPLLLAIVAILQIALVPATDVVQWIRLIDGHIDLKQYYAAHTASWFVASDVVNAAEYIRGKTKPTDGLAVFGNEALINFLSGRANPTRFLAGGSLTLGGPESPRSAYRREYIRGLQRHPPAYIVLGMAFNSTKERALHGFPELEELLYEKYSLERRFGYLDLYILKPFENPR